MVVVKTSIYVALTFWRKIFFRKKWLFFSTFQIPSQKLFSLIIFRPGCPNSSSRVRRNSLSENIFFLNFCLSFLYNERFFCPFPGKVSAGLSKLHSTCQEFSERKIVFGHSAIFLTVPRKSFGGVVRTVFYASIGTFWGINFFLKIWVFISSLADTEWKSLGFLLANLHRKNQNCFLPVDINNLRKNFIERKNFATSQQLFKSLSQKTFSCVARIPFYVSIGENSRNILFSKEKSFFIPQTSRFLFVNFSFIWLKLDFTWPSEYFEDKKILPEKYYCLIIFTSCAKKFWAILPKKVGGGGQNSNLRCINLLQKNTFLQEKTVFLISWVPTKNLVFCRVFFTRLSKLHFTCEEELLNEKQVFRQSFFYHFWTVSDFFLSISCKSFGEVVQTAFYVSEGTFSGRT